MKIRIAVATLALGIVLPSVLPAQIGRVIRRAADRVENRVNRDVDQAVDQAVDCALGDSRCVEQAQRDGKKVQIRDGQGNVITDASGNPVQSQEAATAATDAPGTGVWRNYDFVPGDSVWVATDWTNERVGRFPASQLEFVTGNAEIVELGGRKLLEFRSAGSFRVKLPATLPQSFTVEFLLNKTNRYHGVGVNFEPVERWAGEDEETHRFEFEARPGIYQGGSDISVSDDDKYIGKLTPVRIQVDDRYGIVYIGSDRYGQIPNGTFPRTNVITFSVDANEDNPVYLADITVRVGLDPLYDGLMATGAVAAYGILFDVASDRLRPESTPKLNELLSMLKQHGDLKVMIEGHTDSTGDDAANLALSDRRARSVVSWLTSNGIDAGRLQAVGKGETEAVADNASEAGRQQNRRVVIRKM